MTQHNTGRHSKPESRHRDDRKNKSTKPSRDDDDHLKKKNADADDDTDDTTDDDAENYSDDDEGSRWRSASFILTVVLVIVVILFISIIIGARLMKPDEGDKAGNISAPPSASRQERPSDTVPPETLPGNDRPSEENKDPNIDTSLPETAGSITYPDILYPQTDGYNPIQDSTKLDRNKDDLNKVRTWAHDMFNAAARAKLIDSDGYEPSEGIGPDDYTSKDLADEYFYGNLPIAEEMVKATMSGWGLDDSTVYVYPHDYTYTLMVSFELVTDDNKPGYFAVGWYNTTVNMFDPSQYGVTKAGYDSFNRHATNPNPNAGR